jgi:hypothetical protein
VKVALSYLVSFGGAGILAYAVWLAAAVNCNYAAVRFQLINMLRTQPWQAEIMTKTNPWSFLDGLHSAMKIAGSTGLRDPDQVAMASRPSYDASTVMIGLHWKNILGKVKMGGLGLLGGLVVAFGVGTLPVLHIILVVGGIAAAIWIVVTKTDCERYVTLARLEILPEIDRAIAEGRYGKPPA